MLIYTYMYQGYAYQSIYRGHTGILFPPQVEFPSPELVKPCIYSPPPHRGCTTSIEYCLSPPPPKNPLYNPVYGAIIHNGHHMMLSYLLCSMYHGIWQTPNNYYFHVTVQHHRNGFSFIHVHTNLDLVKIMTQISLNHQMLVDILVKEMPSQKSSVDEKSVSVQTIVIKF